MALGSILSGAAGLISAGASLFGPKPLSQRKAIGLEYDYQQKTAQDMPALQVEGWQKAGLNPAMMATSSGNMMTQGPQVGPASYDGSMAGLSSGLQTFADAVSGMQQVGPDAKKREALETQILEKRLEVLNRGLNTKPETGLRMENRSDELGLTTQLPNTAIDLMVDYRLPNGRIVKGPNPEISEMDQALFAKGFEEWRDLDPKIDETQFFGTAKPPKSKPKTTWRTGETF